MIDRYDNKPLIEISKILLEHVGTCPLDMFEYEPWDKPCSEICEKLHEGRECWKCWYKYANSANK